MQKTNAMRLLDSLQVPYEAVSYDTTDDHLDAVQTALLMGVEPEIVYKTLIVENEKGLPAVLCLPSNYDLDLRKAAKATNSKRVSLIHLKALLPLTGYVRGGCSPLAMKKAFPTFIEETATMHPMIFVNAGKKGLQIGLSPLHLKEACQADFADLL